MLQPASKLYKRHLLLCSNVVVQVEPDIPFKILTANFSGIRRQTVKGQEVATVLPHITLVIPGTVTSTEVLGSADAQET